MKRRPPSYAAAQSFTRHDRSRLALPAERPLRLAVVADTHSLPHPRLHEQLRTLAPDAIVHAGDIGDGRVLDDLAAIAPLYAVRGNIDDPALVVPDARTLWITKDDDTAFTMLLVHIGVSGPRVRADVAALAEKEGAALVICGHSHIPFIGRDRGLTLFNPGSIGPRRLGLPIVYGLVTIGQSVSLTHLDAETGGAWEPPRVSLGP